MIKENKNIYYLSTFHFWNVGERRLPLLIWWATGVDRQGASPTTGNPRPSVTIHLQPVHSVNNRFVPLQLGSHPMFDPHTYSPCIESSL